MLNAPVPAAAGGMSDLTAISEEPHAKAHRLAEQLADVLDSAFGGRFGAEIFPSRMVGSRGSIGFFDIASQSHAWRRGRRALNYLSRLRRMTPDELVSHHSKGLRRALLLQERAQ